MNQELKVKIDETSLTSNNLQNLINSASIGTIFLDRSLRVAMFTPAVREIFNLIPADHGRPLSDITHRLEYQGLLQDAERVLDKLTIIEQEVKTADGRIYIMRVLPYRTAEDHINGVAITFVDITVRKQAEDDLRASKERMEKAFSIETVGILFFKPTGEITGANDAFLQMMGYSREDLNNGKLRLNELMPEEFMPASRKLMEEFWSSGRITPYEKQYIRKDGSRIWTLFSASRVTEDEGVEFVIDITRQKQLQQQKDEFIAIASHELKTPVTSIKMLAEVLLERFQQSKEDKNSELAQKLVGQIDRLNDLIRDLLETTKIAEGKLVLKPEPFDLNALITEQVELLQRINSAPKLVFQPGKLKTVTADKERITQVLTNILYNAIKYSPDGKEIVITSEVVPQGVQVSVKDQGIGIPQNMLQNVFNRFFRINNPKVQSYPGMGLGLYISAGIIQQHGGTIMVDSKEGKGSEFRFTIPYNQKG